MKVTYLHVPVKGDGEGMSGGEGMLGVPGSTGVDGGLTVTGVGGLPPQYPPEGGFDGVDGVEGVGS